MFLQTVKELLENPTQTVNDMSYFNCLDSVMENSKVSPVLSEIWGRMESIWEGVGGKEKSVSSIGETHQALSLGVLQEVISITSGWHVLQVLGESMAGISQNAKNSKLPEFGDSISAASKALCGLTEAAAQVRCVHFQP